MVFDGDVTVFVTLLANWAVFDGDVTVFVTLLANWVGFDGDETCFVTLLALEGLEVRRESCIFE